MHRVLPLSLICFALLGMPAQAADLAITEAWSRATSGTTGVVYFTVTDSGAPDTLASASTPVAATAQLHETRQQDGVMQMRPVDNVTISQDQPLKLAPGGYHLMLTGLTKPLNAGDTFPLTLVFAQAGAISTTVKVEKAGAKAPAADMPGMDSMPGMDMGH